MKTLGRRTRSTFGFTFVYICQIGFGRVHFTVSTKLQNTYCDIKLGACAVLLAACRAGAFM